MEKMYQSVIEIMRKDYEDVTAEKNKEIGRLRDDQIKQQAKIKELKRTVTEQDNVMKQMESLIDKSPCEKSVDISRFSTCPSSEESPTKYPEQDDIVREQARKIVKLQRALAVERGKSGKLEEKLSLMNN